MRNILVTDFFEETVRRFPDKEAFVDEKRSISFTSLRVESRHIASSLLLKGIFRKPIVVYLEKSVECISAFLGVTYSGNFYTPIDTHMPDARIALIIDTLKPAAFITDWDHSSDVQKFSGDIPIIIYSESQSEKTNEELIDDSAEKIIDNDILYILFTSGSTGTPKGVAVSHRSAVDYVDWYVEKFRVTEKDIFGNQAPLHFDLSIQDVYAPMFSGCTVHLLPRRMFSFPRDLMGYLVEHKINVIMWVPSALCAVANLKGLNNKVLPELRLVTFCGEVMPNKQLNMWRKAFPETVFVNLYGPTEACDASTYFIVNRAFSDDESLPIGVPCRNTDILILNENEQEIQEGEIGELCIRGSSLALGYYNNPAKTAEAFVQNPLNASYPELIYRTGDLVKYNEYNELIYVGRKDFQIKHLGHRIELGEIENAASAISGVDENCCLYDPKRYRIFLFYSGGTEPDEVKKKLKDLVPEYMLPGIIRHLKAMPHNQNGKIDREKLKEEF